MRLQPGTFDCGQYRKAIPTWVKIACAFKAHAANGFSFNGAHPFDWIKSLRYDHRPALCERPYDTEKGDFLPPQNDPDFIEAIPREAHDKRTFGREPGAQKTATTVGSDAHNRAHSRHLHDSELIHQAKIAAKRGDDKAAVAFLSQVRQRTRLRRKRKITNRGFQKRPPAKMRLRGA